MTDNISTIQTKLDSFMDGYRNMITNYQEISNSTSISDDLLHLYFSKIRSIIYKLNLLLCDVQDTNINMLSQKISGLNQFEQELINDVDKKTQLFNTYLPVIAMFEYLKQFPNNILSNKNSDDNDCFIGLE